MHVNLGTLLGGLGKITGLNNVSLSVDTDHANVDLLNGTLTIVPEPSTYALFGAAGALALALVRRRRRA